MANGSDRPYLIAVGLDGSDYSWKAFTEALEQARLKQATLHIVSVQESVEASYSASEVLASEHTASEHLQRIHEKAKSQAAAAGVQTTTAIAHGHPEAGLAEYVKQHHINLLIVGDKGHSSILSALIGTTAEKIVRSAPCSVLIVR